MNPHHVAPSREVCGIERAGEIRPLTHFSGTRSRLLPPDPKIALVVGTFAGLPYIHLHLEARRRLYPEVPLLVHDDGSPLAAELSRLCQRYGAVYERNTRRLPPCEGDLTAFIGGLAWARELQCDLLVKMSRRWVPLIRWVEGLQDVARDADYPTYSSWTTSFNFGFRTECMALAVEEWFRLGLVDEILSEMDAGETVFVEGLMHRLARKAASFRSAHAWQYDQRIGLRPPDRDGYAPWPFVGTDRCERSADHFWHDVSQPADYAALSQRWGLPYAEADFVDPNMGFGDGTTLEPTPPTTALGPAPIRVVVYTVCHNEQALAPWFAMHYTWAERIVFYDDSSTDQTRERLREFHNVEVRSFDSGGVLDNGLLVEIKDHCWKECRGTGVDFVIVVDADEFVWAPRFSDHLAQLKEDEITLLRPTGYDMISEQMPRSDGTLTEQVRSGVLNSDYSKPAVFDPNRIKEIAFTPGCHNCQATGLVRERVTDEVKLLHYRFLSPEFYLARNAIRSQRRSTLDRIRGWGFHHDRSDAELLREFAEVQAKAVPVV